MVREFPPYLKLLPADAAPAEPLAEDWASLDGLCLALEPLLGGRLSREAGPPTRGAAQSWPLESGPEGGQWHLRLEPYQSRGRSAQQRRQTASAVAELWNRLAATRQALWERDAELAAGVPVTAHPEERRQLAERMQAVLQSGARIVGCQASAVYLLDAATTELKLRAAHGLPFERRLAKARPLEGAVADLEAMSGHAVVVDDLSLASLWSVPEKCGAALCVPVSTPMAILGTLWIFSREPRDFTDDQTEIAELVAGRIAADLERTMLLGACLGQRAAQQNS